MKLNQIRNRAGAHKRKTRVGRGSSSGLGKTAGRGVKGAKARAGASVKGFEGGQTALHRRLPKRGFYNHFANDFAEVNLGRIQAAIDAGRLKATETINQAALHAAGLVRNARDGVRLLGQGELKAKLVFEVAGASKPAVEAVKKSGGSVTMTFKKPAYMNKKGEPGKRVQRRKKAAEKRAQANAG
jgi:large subunit ribosomal protein L15